MKSMYTVCAAVLMATTITVEAIQSDSNSLFNPRAVTVVHGAPLTVASGETIAFNTDTLTFSGTYSGNGEKATNQSGYVEMAMFTFPSLTIEAGAGVSVTGSRGLVLASQNHMTISQAIAVSGGDGQAGNMGSAGLGGPGAAGDSLTTGSKPPPSTGGDGGGGQGTATAVGPGRSVNCGNSQGAGGAGYGGAGGNGNPGTAGGAAYGNKQLDNLYGGSGAGGQNYAFTANGGGGGGSLELVACYKMVLNAAIGVKGGNGGSGDGSNRSSGGGSGGGLILAAGSLTLGASASVDASGGKPWISSDNYSFYGGGGGGGRVAFYYTTLSYGGGYTSLTLGDGTTADVPNVVGIEGGDDTTKPENPGVRGTFYANAGGFPYTPPPAGTLIMIK